MFLEMHKPLTTLAATAYALGQPPLVLFFGFRRSEELRLLLSERENVEALMQRIELHSRQRSSPPKSADGLPTPAVRTDGTARKKAGEP
jgi:hypothetical protein